MGKAAARSSKSSPAGSHLRVAHVWHDEVMADEVYSSPRKVTLGTTKGSTFTIPDLDLPERFCILRPGRRGYVLTLGSDMAGRLGRDGDEIDIAEFIREQGGGGRAGGSAGDFHATPIGPGDWGVIKLDGTGDHNLFFQFVAEDLPLPPPMWRDAELLLPAIAFALILHTVLLVASFSLRESGNNLVFPGRRDLMASYLVRRPPELEEEKGQEEAASKDGEKENVNSASKGDEGKAGGEGDEPLAQDPNAENLPPEAPRVALLDDQARSTFNRVIAHRAMDDRITRLLNRMGPRTPGAFSGGKGSGLGLGDDANGTGTTRGSDRGGPGGGGSADKLFVSQGKIDAGETRSPKGTGGKGRAPKEVVVVGTGSASGDFAGWTRDEIQSRIMSRKGFIRACYQKELNRVQSAGGKVVVQFRIQGSGDVTTARVVGDKSTLRNSQVESCITRQIKGLKFPPKGTGSALVEFPFIFSQG